MNNIDKTILGTVQLGINYGINNTIGMPDMKVSNDILSKAYLNGIRSLDTAEAYGCSQQVIGNYHLNHLSQKFNVITKLSLDNQSIIDIKSNVENNCQILNIERLEGYLFHSFHEFVKYPNIYKDLLSLKESGLINKIGVSIYTNEELDHIIKYTNIGLIQLPVNVLDNYNIKGILLKQAKDKGCEIHVRSVYLQGLLLMDEDKIKPKLQPLIPYIRRLKEIAVNANILFEQLCLGYLFKIKEIDKILIGLETVEQLEKNIELIKSAELSNDLIDAVNEITVTEKGLLHPSNWI